MTIGWLEPPHPDPLPDGERERAELSISSVLNPDALGLTRQSIRLSGFILLMEGRVNPRRCGGSPAHDEKLRGRRV